jgi:hypothetical protein
MALALMPRMGLAQVIRGTLVDDRSLAPVEGALIRLLDDGGSILRTAISDEQGLFFFEANLGTYQLEAQRIGYRLTRSQSFRMVLDTLRVEFRIDQEAVLLAPLVVNVGRRPGREVFESRVNSEQGFFFPPAMVDSLRPKTHVGEIFSHADDTFVRWSAGYHEDGKFGPLPRIGTWIGSGCMHIIVDGRPTVEPFFQNFDVRGRLQPGSIWGVWPLSDLEPEDLVAIEVYRAWFEVPEDFRRDLVIEYPQQRKTLRQINQKACGIAFIWTTHGWD